jgi:SAM-dependent methyltransferase
MDKRTNRYRRDINYICSIYRMSLTEASKEIKVLYENRFKGELRRKNEIWKVLCSSYLQRYINENDIVLDVGAGYCEFINNIRCGKKYALDLNENTRDFADPDVKVFNNPSTEISTVLDSDIDIVFMSNFLEHLKTKDEILKTLSEIYQILKLHGKLLILQPNIRYAYKYYWDFFDHYIPLSDKSLVEALEIVGFKIEFIVSKFLPYTTKSIIPKVPFFLMKTYLKLPIIWKIMGKQMFVIANKETEKQRGS